MHQVGCKCMTCAGERWDKAEELARVSEPDKFFDLVGREDVLNAEIAGLSRDLKAVKTAKHDLVMHYYNEANYGEA